MQWPASVLAWYANSAGWSGNDTTTAVAVALAGSGGDDQWFWSPDVVTVPNTVGVWCVPDTGKAPVAQFDLYRIGDNAKAAHALWVANGRSWVWSPVWLAGMWHAYMADAKRGTDAPLPGVPASVRFRALRSLDGTGQLVRQAQLTRGAILDAVTHIRTLH